DAEAAPELLSRAIRAAESGTPGPAVLVLPEDILGEPLAGEAAEPRRPEWPAPAETAVDEVELLLRRARRPLALPGAAVTSPAGPEPHQPLGHVYPDEGRIGVVHRTELGLACDPVALLHALAGRPGPPVRDEREAWARELHDYEVEKAVWRPVEAEDGIVFGE